MQKIAAGVAVICMLVLFPASGCGTASTMTDTDLVGVWRCDDFDERQAVMPGHTHEAPVELYITDDGYMYLARWYDGTDMGVHPVYNIYVWTLSEGELIFVPVYAEDYAAAYGQAEDPSQGNYPDFSLAVQRGRLKGRLQYYQGSEKRIDDRLTFIKADEPIPYGLSRADLAQVIEDNRLAHEAVLQCAADFEAAIGRELVPVDYWPDGSYPNSAAYKIDGVWVAILPWDGVTVGAVKVHPPGGWGAVLEGYANGPCALVYGWEDELPAGWPQAFMGLYG